MTTTAKADLTVEQIKALKPEQIMESYSGKPGCACGCRGKYSVNPTFKAEADKERGYEQENCNFAQVKKALKIVQQNVTDGDPQGDCTEQCIGEDFASVTIETGYESYRVYTVYLASVAPAISARERAEQVLDVR